jgi:D-alanyl-D-alanine endopeptidase (penicillin-binding protein 7)
MARRLLVAAVVVGSLTPTHPARAGSPPEVKAASAAVIDAATGEVLYGKGIDEVRAIASTTKIFVAMVVRRRGIDLGGVTQITREDFRYARGGAATRLDIRRKFRNLDLLRAMLIASDNRAPTALGRAVGLSTEELIAEMNTLAARLGLKRTRFNHPNGLGGNESTARELALAHREAMKDPVLAEIMATQRVDISTVGPGAAHIRYFNTNGALHSKKYHVTGGKTGFTDAAGYCLVISARIAGRDVVMAFLGAKGKQTRFADFDRLAGWLTPPAGTAATATATATASPQP